MDNHSGYQNTATTSLPDRSQQQSTSNNSLSKQDSDPNFESWLNDEPKTKSKGTNNQSSIAKQTGDINQSAPAKPKEQPAANLISFDDDKWADDDDAGWESIDTK